MEILFGHRHCNDCTKKLCLQKKYELRIRVLSRVTWSVSHCDIACKIRLRCEIEWFMCVAEQVGLISCILCRECLAWIARCDDWTENWSTYVMIARVRLQQINFCTHFLCAPQDWCKRSPLHCWNDIQCTCSDDSDPCPGHGNITCMWQLACEDLYRSPILFNAWINATFFFESDKIYCRFLCNRLLKVHFRVFRFPSVFRDRGKSSSLDMVISWQLWGLYPAPFRENCLACVLPLRDRFTWRCDRGTRSQCWTLVNMIWKLCVV